MNHLMRRSLPMLMVLALLFLTGSAFCQTPFGDDSIKLPVADQGSQLNSPGQGNAQNQTVFAEPTPTYVTQAEPTNNIRQVLSAQARRQIQFVLPEFIRKFVGIFGVNLPKGYRVVIPIGSNGTSTPTTTTTPVSSPASKQKVVLAGNIQGLRKQLAARFGINTIAGDRATWSQRQLEEAYKTLNSLPIAFRMFTKNIQRDGIYGTSANVLGYVRMGDPTVHLCNSACKDGTFQGTLVHEMTHCFQASNPEVTKKWESTFWPYGRAIGARPPSVTTYGNTQPNEDMAESVRVYWANGAAMRSSQPARYEFIKKYVMNGKTF